MQAWRYTAIGEPGDQFVLDEVPEPKPADFAGLGMDLGGWVPLQPGAEPFGDWVLMRMSAAALALPDVTMARGTYPVPVLRPYISGQEGVGVVIEASPGRQDMLGKRVAAVCIQPWGSLAPIAVGISSIFPVPDALSDEDAAGFMIAAHTAYHAAIRRGGVTSGETVLITGCRRRHRVSGDSALRGGRRPGAGDGRRPGEGGVRPRNSAPSRSTTRARTWWPRRAA